MSDCKHYVLHHPSPLDDAAQPYLVTAPAELPSRPIPAVVVLHRELANPTADGFLEEAFKLAARFGSALRAGAPALLVQPFGRGNAAWLGPAGADLFAMLAQLEERFRIGQRALVGFAAGATGALQLATRHPKAFASAAAVGGWFDDRLGLPLGADDWPPWERSRRVAAAPRLQVRSLGETPVLLGADDDPAAFEASHHQDILADALAEAGANFARTADLAEVWRFATAQRGDAAASALPPLESPRGFGWRRATVVVGTLSDDAETAALRTTAEAIRSRWLRGADSMRLDPGDRTTVVDYRIATDEEFLAEPSAVPGDLAIVGSPRTNLLLARWMEELPIAWPTGRRSDAFEVAGLGYDDPRATAFASAPRPDEPTGTAYVYTAVSPGGLGTLARTPTAFFPDYLVFRGSQVLAWGDFP